MREVENDMKIKEENFFMKKNKLMRTKNIATALLIAFFLAISSSVIGIDSKNNQMEIITRKKLRMR